MKRDGTRRFGGWRYMLLCGLWLTVSAALGQQPADEAAGSAAADQAPPTRPLLYFFEHHALRNSAFSFDQDVQALVADPANAGQPVSRIFSRAAMQTIGMPGVDVENLMDNVGPYMREISIEKIRRGGYTMYLLRMPAPAYAPEAYFIGIVYRDGEPRVEGETAASARYFMFEHTTVDNHVFEFGEWTADGEHKTHGYGDRVPTIRDFIATIYANLGIRSTGQALGDLALMHWLTRYGEAWENKDPELAANLFTDDATYQETPFDDAMVGAEAIREYWAGVTADQDDISFDAEIVAIDGMTAVVGWSAEFQSISADAPLALNGVFVLEFEDDETVSSLREWWHAQ